MHKKV